MRLACIGMLLLLAGCTHMTPTPPAKPWNPKQGWLAQCPDWSASGKMGLRVNNKGGALTFQWHEQQDKYDVEVSGPLGQGQAQMHGDAMGVTLVSAETGEIHADQPEDLLERYLGVRAPFSALRGWLHGQPTSGNADTQVDDNGLLKQLQEQNWTVSYSDYQLQGQLYLPSRIDVSGQNLRIKLALHDWNIPATCQEH